MAGPGHSAGRCLLDLCRRADRVFAGVNEVEALVGPHSSNEFAATIGLDGGRQLVSKLVRAR